MLDSSSENALALMRAHFLYSALVAEAGEPHLQVHLEAVARYTGILARWMGTPPPTAMRMEVAALAHDLGKASIPREILLKPARLNSREYSFVQSHADAGHGLLHLLKEMFIRVGVENLLDGSTLQMAMDAALYHHENWDGSGYPKGLCGDEIPFVARLVHVADVIDALLNHRPYKLAWSWTRVRSELGRQSGKYFDPAIVNTLFGHENEFLAQVQLHAKEGSSPTLQVTPGASGGRL